MKSTPSLLEAPLFSPKGYLLWASAFLILFGVVHLAGFREATSVLALTVPEGMTVARASTYAGIYLMLYMIVTVLCPILVLAAGIQAAVERFVGDDIDQSRSWQAPNPKQARSG